MKWWQILLVCIIAIALLITFFTIALSVLMALDGKK